VYVLLDNAAKYSPKESDIRIKASLGENETVEVSVEDSGKGIDPGSREKVFEKFYRSSANGTHSTRDGLGLGLSIARGIIESQDGKIWIANGTDGYTTRIAFQLPLGGGSGHTHEHRRETHPGS
jgi:two-component system sensor histidine kinase KdpD